LTAFCVRGEPISYADAIQGEFTPIKVGDPWGPPWSTTWFHVRGHVPDHVEGQRVIACFDLGYDGPTGFTCEALAWKDGKPWRGVDPNHRWLPIDGPEVDFSGKPIAGDGDGKPQCAQRRAPGRTLAERLLKQAIRETF